MTPRELEAILKMSFQSGKFHLELSDEDIEYLLEHSEIVRPSKNLLRELEEILLNAARRRKVTAMAVQEADQRYGESADVCSVAEALSEELSANGWTRKEAAARLRVKEATVGKLLKTTVPLKAGKVRQIVDLLAVENDLPAHAKDLLSQWLLNGVRYREMKRRAGKLTPMRSAARKKKK